MSRAGEGRGGREGEEERETDEKEGGVHEILIVDHG